MNKISVMGRLTSDPRVKYTAGDTPKAFAAFSVAVPKKYAKNEADFFDFVSFGKVAEFVEKYFKKGSMIIVHGRLENNNYTDKEGRKVKSNHIVAEEVEFGESKREAEKKEEPEEFVHVPENISDSGLPFN